MPLANSLSVQNNSASVYFPISARSDKSNEFNWEIVTGLFIANLFGISINKKQLEKYKTRCKSHFESKLNDSDYWEIIEKIYFERNHIHQVSPEMQSLKVQGISDPNAAPAERMANVLSAMLFDLKAKPCTNISLNFIEEELRAVFLGEFQFSKSGKTLTSAPPYLPQLSRWFKKDLQFLLSNPDYLLQHITQFLRFYIFIYTSQLALTINSWRDGEPQGLKDCFFILDSEKASKERSMLQQRGSKQVEQSIPSLFPVLAMNESLQNSADGIVPLWSLYQDIADKDVGKLNQYLKDFAEDRKLELDGKVYKSASEALSTLLDLSKQQFKKGESRSSAGANFINFTKRAICQPFTQSRGSAGKVFVLNQEFLLLLTNLAIGEQGQMRLHELLVEFKKRGVFFDRESQTALVDFYERLGNVERKSDSGDAVYVKATV